MPEEKKETKPGMVNALSRILHLHQLPNQPTEKWPSNAEPVIPIHAQNKPTVNASVNTSPTINPPFVSPARVAPSAPIPSRPAPATSTTASPAPVVRATPLVSTAPLARPNVTPTPTSSVKPMVVKPAPTSTAKSSPWPFQAPWNAGKNKGMGPLPASASTTYPSAPTPATATPASVSPAPAKPTPIVRAPIPTNAPASSTVSPPSPAPMNMQASISSAGNRIAGAESIVTNYDRILDLVRLNQNMKLDDLTRAMQMDEERVAEELQTLEDNGLIEIRYPAFGEPIVHYKG